VRRSALAADEQDRELLTADAREQVAGSQLGLPGHGRALEQRVAGGMPERVVEGLEPVEVERHDGERLPGPMGSGDGGLQLGVPAAAVRDAGERIGGAEGIELSGLRADLTDESRHAPQHEQEEHSGCGADHHQVRFSPPGARADHEHRRHEGGHREEHEPRPGGAAGPAHGARLAR
jgi:hypothetical protein